MVRSGQKLKKFFNEKKNKVLLRDIEKKKSPIKGHIRTLKKKLKDILYSWIKRLSIEKRLFLHKLTYPFNMISIKTPAEFGRNRAKYS